MAMDIKQKRKAVEYGLFESADRFSLSNHNRRKTKLQIFCRCACIISRSSSRKRAAPNRLTASLLPQNDTISPKVVRREQTKKTVLPLKKKAHFSALIADTVSSSFELICRNYAERPLLGTRTFSGSYQWITYGSFLTMVEAFASGLVAMVPPNSAVAICAGNIVEWLVADWACVRAGLFSVPIHVQRAHHLSGLADITAATKVSVAICAPDLVAAFSALNGVNLVVEIGSAKPSSTPCGAPGSKACTVVVGFEEVVARGTGAPTAPVLRAPGDLSTLYFSSGTTGRPKAVALSEAEVLADLRDAAADEDADLESESSPPPLPPVQLAIYSFAYSLERDNFQTVALLGGKLALFDSPLVHVFDDLGVLKPTTILGVPALWAALHQRFRLHVAAALESKPELSRQEAEQETRTALQKQLGPQLEVVSSGTAPLSPEVRRFLWEVFPDTFIGEGYGTQETGLITLEGVVQSGVKVRLRDLPELGYTTKDKPWPRGEICVRTPSLFSGYFMTCDVGDDASSSRSSASSSSSGIGSSSSSSSDGDGGCGTVSNSNANKGSPAQVIVGGKLNGYFPTGDIGELCAGKRPRKGSKAARREVPAPTLLRVVDRVKSMFKNSNGEFVSPAAIEAVLSSSARVHQVLVHGRASMDQVEAVVVPAWSAEGPAHASGETASEFWLQELCLVGQGLRFHERPARVVVAPAAWTASNGFLTPSLKLNRPRIISHFLKLDGCDLLGAVNPLEALLPAYLLDTALLSDAGLDSLAAYRIASQFPSAPLAWLLQPTATVGELRERVRGNGGNCRGGGASRGGRNSSSSSSSSSSIDAVEEAGAREERLIADDVENMAQKFMQRGLLAPSTGGGGRRRARGGTEGRFVLLTGATGFLGSAILVELLRSWPESAVACLVRCEGGETVGKHRIRSLLQRARLWEPCFEARIEVVVGCLEMPHFGLPLSSVQALAERFPLVVHCAARVDWVRPYTALRPANVCGTGEVLSFCLEHVNPPLPLVHVSTGAVASLDGADFASGPHASLSVHQLQAASGYVATKAVAEALVERARTEGQLPCVVLRPGTVSAHSETGYGNAEDFTSRYLGACAQLRLCVDAPALCEFIPVDFVAAVTAAAANMLLANSQPRPSRSVFAVSNPSSPSFSALSNLLEGRHKNTSTSGSSHSLNLRMCPPREFLQGVRAAETCRLQPLLIVIEDDSFWCEDGEVDPCNELWATIIAQHAPQLTIPAIDGAYISRALDWLEQATLF